MAVRCDADLGCILSPGHRFGRSLKVQLQKDLPRYSEAYPRISMGDALRSWRDQKPDVLWRDRHGQAVGIAQINWDYPNTVSLTTHIMDLPYFNGGSDSVQISVEYKGSTRDNLRPYAVCDGCRRHVDNIIYGNEQWRCKICLGLANRSTLIDPVVRITEELMKIEKSIGEGRPLGMRMKTFEALQQLYRALNRDLSGRPRRTSSREYQAHIRAEWLARQSAVAEHMVSMFHEPG